MKQPSKTIEPVDHVKKAGKKLMKEMKKFTPKDSKTFIEENVNINSSFTIVEEQKNNNDDTVSDKETGEDKNWEECVLNTKIVTLDKKAFMKFLDKIVDSMEQIENNVREKKVYTDECVERIEKLIARNYVENDERLIKLEGETPELKVWIKEYVQSYFTEQSTAVMQSASSNNKILMNRLNELKEKLESVLKSPTQSQNSGQTSKIIIKDDAPKKKYIFEKSTDYTTIMTLINNQQPIFFGEPQTFRVFLEEHLEAIKHFPNMTNTQKFQLLNKSVDEKTREQILEFRPLTNGYNLALERLRNLYSPIIYPNYDIMQLLRAVGKVSLKDPLSIQRMKNVVTEILKRNMLDETNKLLFLDIIVTYHLDKKLRDNWISTLFSDNNPSLESIDEFLKHQL